MAKRNIRQNEGGKEKRKGKDKKKRKKEREREKKERGSEWREESGEGKREERGVQIPNYREPVGQNFAKSTGVGEILGDNLFNTSDPQTFPTKYHQSFILCLSSQCSNK